MSPKIFCVPLLVILTCRFQCIPAANVRVSVQRESDGWQEHSRPFIVNLCKTYPVYRLQDHCALPRNGLKVAQTNVSFLRPLHTGERFIHVINLQVYIFELLFLWFVLYTAKKRLFFLEGGRFVSAQRIKRHQPVTSQVITMADLMIVFVIVVYYMTKNATLWRRFDKDDFGWVTLIAAIYICRFIGGGLKP